MNQTYVSLPTFGGWRNQTGDGPGGLAKGPLLIAVSAGFTALILFWSGQLIGALIGIVITAITVLVSLPVKGLPTSWYIARDLRWIKATLTKDHSYRSGLLHEGSLAPDGEVELPGPLAAKRLVEAQAGFGSADPWALIYDEATQQLTVSWIIDPPATDMANNTAVGTFTHGWGGVLDQVNSLPEIDHLAVSVLTTGGTAQSMADRIVASVHDSAPPLARQVLESIAEIEAAQSSSATTTIEATFTRQEGSLEEQVAAITRNVPSIERSFAAAGIGAYHRSTTSELVHRVRQIFDPRALPGESEWFRHAGPIALDDRRNYAAVDNAALVSFVMSAGPQKDITPFALSPLLTPTERPTRLTLIWRPFDAATAARLTEAARKPNVINLAIASMGIKDPSKKDEIEAEHREEIAEHLARGNGLGNIGLYVTTWLDDVADLDAVQREIRSKATASGLDLRPATTMHAANATIGIGAGIRPGKAAA